jgi:GTP cyclohydrolase II
MNLPSHWKPVDGPTVIVCSSRDQADLLFHQMAMLLKSFGIKDIRTLSGIRVIEIQGQRIKFVAGEDV